MLKKKNKDPNRMIKHSISVHFLCFTGPLNSGSYFFGLPEINIEFLTKTINKILNKLLITKKITIKQSSSHIFIKSCSRKTFFSKTYLVKFEKKNNLLVTVYMSRWQLNLLN